MNKTHSLIKVHVCLEIYKFVLMKLCHFNKVTCRLLKWASTISNPRLFILFVWTTIWTISAKPIVFAFFIIVLWRRARTLLVLIFAKVLSLVHHRLNERSYAVIILLCLILADESTELRLFRLSYLWSPFRSTFK
jgi:hypothetical protein